MVTLDRMATAFSHLSPFIKATISTALDSKIIVLFKKYQGFLDHSISFMWAGSDLCSAGVFSNRTWSEIFVDAKSKTCLLTATLMIFSGILGTIVLHKYLMGSEKNSALTAMMQMSNGFLFWSSLLYLADYIEKWKKTNDEKEKWLSVIGITNSLGYLIVSFFGIFGVSSTVLVAIAYIAFLLGIFRIIGQYFF